MKQQRIFENGKLLLLNNPDLIENYNELIQQEVLQKYSHFRKLPNDYMKLCNDLASTQPLNKGLQGS